jgi:hypothetical protein
MTVRHSAQVAAGISPALSELTLINVRRPSDEVLFLASARVTARAPPYSLSL